MISCAPPCAEQRTAPLHCQPGYRGSTASAHLHLHPHARAHMDRHALRDIAACSHCCLLLMPINAMHRELQRAWRAEDVEQRHLDNVRALWARTVEKNRRDVEEKAEQLKAISTLAALVSGFALSAFLQFDFGDYVDTSGAVLPLFGVTMALTVRVLLHRQEPRCMLRCVDWSAPGWTICAIGHAERARVDQDQSTRTAGRTGDDMCYYLQSHAGECLQVRSGLHVR